jgi:hypothetical protein
LTTAEGIPEIVPVLLRDKLVGKDPQINEYVVPVPLARTEVDVEINSVTVVKNPAVVIQFGVVIIIQWQ